MANKEDRIPSKKRSSHMVAISFFDSVSLQENFALIKGLGFFIAFIIGTSIQFFNPYNKSTSLIFRNWAVNFPLAAINIAVMSAVCAGCVGALASFAESHGWGLMNIWKSSEVTKVIAALFFLDLIAYLWHRANHRFSLLWRFHMAHHSDRVFDTSTSLRFHVGELLGSLGIRLLVVFALGLSITGILAFEIIFQFFNVIEHGNIRFPGKLEKILGTVFVTPALHRKHHSINIIDLNSNFGTIFSFWDKLGGTYRDSQSSEHIEVGLPQDSTNPNLWQLLLLPIVRRPSKVR
ncbi:MAG: sterol desaturase family protein [Bdellovibrionales bacterium]